MGVPGLRSVIGVEEYLAGEERSEVRHEFIAGDVYAMAGSSEEHGILAGNLFAALHGHLRGKICRVFMAEMKVRLLLRTEDVFYYPDLMVVCDPRDTERYFKRFPKVLIEVLSETTERIDRREKRWSYIQLESLEEYVLVAQDKQEVTVYRRSGEWTPEIVTATEGLLILPSLEFSLPLAAIYEGLPLRHPPNVVGSVTSPLL